MNQHNLHIEVYTNHQLNIESWIIGNSNDLLDFYRDDLIRTHESLSDMQVPLFICPIQKKPDVGQITSRIFSLDLLNENNSIENLAVFLINKPFFQNCCSKSNKSPLLKFSELTLISDAKTAKKWYLNFGFNSFGILRSK